MSAVALDTNSYTALMLGSEIVKKILSSAQRIVLPGVVLGEMYFGFYKGTRYQSNAKTLADFLTSDRVETLHSDDATSKYYGEIAAELRRIGKPMQSNDIWIAALCKQHNLTLITGDTGFDNILGLDVIYP